MTDPDAKARIETLARRLHHPDPSQLFFQVAEIAGQRTYLRHGVTVREGDTVIDAGANVGVAAAFFATMCGAGLVHSFEPVGPVFELLRANLADLAVCEVHEQGLSAAPQKVPITYYPGATAMSGLYAEPSRDRELVRTVLINRGLSEQEAQERLADRYVSQALECELITLSDFLQDERLGHVDLLKIDVERAELDVLAGIEEPDWAKIEQIVIEVHDEDGRSAAIADALSERGYGVARDQEPMMRGTSINMLYATRR